MGFKFTLNSASKTCNRICKNDKVGLFLANTLAKEMKPFVPMDTGALSQSYLVKPFQITYNQGYAKVQFNGVSKLGNPLHYSKVKHAMAGSRWDKAVQPKLGSVASQVSAYLKRI